MKVKPLGDTVMIEVMPTPETVDGGRIFIPEKHRKRSLRGRIIAMSDSCKSKELAEGQAVVVANYGPVEFESKVGDIRICKTEHVLAILIGS